MISQQNANPFHTPLRIIDEGLKASLDMRVGGNIAQDLDALYGYMCLRLANANLKNDIEALDEVSRLLNEIKGAWDSISQPNKIPLAAQPPARDEPTDPTRLRKGLIDVDAHRRLPKSIWHHRTDA